MLADGTTPSVEGAAVAADVSRATAYRYFPTVADLLVAAYPHAGQSSLLGENPPDDPHRPPRAGRNRSDSANTPVRAGDAGRTSARPRGAGARSADEPRSADRVDRGGTLATRLRDGTKGAPKAGPWDWIDPRDRGFRVAYRRRRSNARGSRRADVLQRAGTAGWLQVEPPVCRNLTRSRLGASPDSYCGARPRLALPSSRSAAGTDSPGSKQHQRPSRLRPDASHCLAATHQSTGRSAPEKLLLASVVNSEVDIEPVQRGGAVLLTILVIVVVSAALVAARGMGRLRPAVDRARRLHRRPRRRRPESCPPCSS